MAKGKTPQRIPEQTGTMGRVQRNRILGGIIVVIIVLIGIVLWDYRSAPYLSHFLGTQVATTTPSGDMEEISSAKYTCSEGKSITATYFESKNPVTTLPGEMPIPTGSVSLVLSDGRSLSVPQTISGSGVRYANADETFIFWNKGNTAFIQEGKDQDQTYSGCVALAQVSGTENWKTFASTSMGITVRYPNDYTIRPGYTYQLRGIGEDPISGVKFIVPAAKYQGTNLSSDTGVSVEQLPQNTTCSALDFLPDVGATKKTVKENGVTYDVATFGDAGAGNFYEQTVYALQEGSICTSVRYFIHSTNVGNYTPGTVKEFDHTALISEFDTIRHSLVLTQ